ncbi:TIGR04282 family arsenosugar biosynthesis glycosyltransferase [Sulfidibacter corallicola]|uniref:TIGR04282 family arsenosugar biosynthesis glycosyltransferase n=1 Tax=Sulfidibacter corallicola TaxID=2818388 RepID=A0A8A4TVA8_SULCO|nr:TIGR04282 family arsenosugar biosynthesis glycosyltransferase [Sulfidibacter corallicola]QTD52942.1 TIGR04282 family arsenosugar biosynthesis glycosyltransferase [Sulfidibacter corallicola]
MKCALICFLKYPEPGHVKTRLAAHLGEPQAAELYAALAERVITEVYPLSQSYDLILCHDPAHDVGLYREWIGDTWVYWEQESGDLGTRMSCAVDRALDEGYGRIAVIGSDCIGMDEAFIDGVFSHLAEHDFVIGPSTDGGYYLIALQEYSPWIFDDIEWSTETVLETTLSKVEARELSAFQLDAKMDIDSLDDLTRFRRELPEEHFLAKKIDQLVLEHISPSNVESTEGEDPLTRITKALQSGQFNTLPVSGIEMGGTDIDDGSP